VHEPLVEKQRQSRPVVYVAPPQEQIEKLARAVCQKLSERQGKNYCDTATVQGFTSFLKTVVSIQVKARNAGGAHVSQKAG